MLPVRILRTQRLIKFIDKSIFRQNRAYSDKKLTKYFGGDKKKGIVPSKKWQKTLETIKNKIVPWDPHDDVVPWIDSQPEIPKECDVVIIGGGIMGSSIAYWLKKKMYHGTRILVVEKDPLYATASTVLSAGGLRQQFSLRENIEMSLFGAEFLRDANTYLGIDGQPPVDVYFNPYGYLMLASENGAKTLEENSRLQNFLGANNVLMTPEKLEDMFPWLNTDGVALGCFGLDKEGWFDPWSLLCAFKKKAIVMGVNYVYAEAKAFMYDDGHLNEDEKINRLVVQTPEGDVQTISFCMGVIAAGHSSSEVAKLAKIGTADGLRALKLPVEPRKRYVYCFHCPDGPGINTPMTIDYTGTYFRREGLAGTYICGKSPEPEEEPPVDDLSVDYDYFEEKVWPLLAKRVPLFEKLKLKSCWAGYYEYNTFDQNGVIGAHPFHHNIYFATGFSGHGIQQAPAVGRAIAELIVNGEFKTIDLSKFGFKRFIQNEPLIEQNIV